MKGERGGETEQWRKRGTNDGGMEGRQGWKMEEWTKDGGIEGRERWNMEEKKEERRRNGRKRGTEDGGMEGREGWMKGIKDEELKEGKTRGMG